MDAHCQCRTITFTTPLPTPLKVYICHCLECRAQSSSTYGITLIFPYFPLPDNPHLKSWSRITFEGREKKCYFCDVCGVRIAHWIEGQKLITVKGCVGTGLTREMIKGATHIYVRSAITEIPEGAERWETEPEAGTAG